MHRKKRIMIIAGESSGELYGALLVRKMKELIPDVDVLGVGGPKMEAEGVEIIESVTGAFGLTEAASSVKQLIVTYKKVTSLLKILQVDLLVLIDFPEFNMMVARRAKQLDIKILYYVSPQVWAWRRGRIREIARVTEKIAALLPFEPELYEPFDGDCEFVGHPVMEEILDAKWHSQWGVDGRTESVDKVSFYESHGLDTEKPVIAILPGSRHSELSRHLPVLMAALSILKKSRPELQYVLSLAPNIKREDFSYYFDYIENLGVKLTDVNAVELLSVSHTAIIASGTAAFQGALLKVPMVVIYKMSPLSYILGKQLIKLKYINLTNLIFDKPVVTELIQENASAKNIVREFEDIYGNEGRRFKTKLIYDELILMYKDKRPSERVAQIVKDLLYQKTP